MTIEFTGIEFATAREAVQYAEAGGGKAIVLGGTHYVMREAEADRLAAAGVELAYLHDYVMPDGAYRIFTVPIN